MYFRNRLKLVLGLAAAVAPFAAFAGGNLVVDGDFESPVTSESTNMAGLTTVYDGTEALFSTDYSYQDPAEIEAGYIATTEGNYSEGLAAEGTAGIWSDPQTAHDLWLPILNNGTNNELLVNGSPTAKTTVWSGVLDGSIVKGDKYTLSVDLASLYYQNPAVLDFKVGGTQVEFDLTSPSQNASYTTWQTYTATFTAASSSTEGTIIDTNILRSGNDFAMDNISLVQAVPEPFTMTLGACALGLAVRRKLAKK